VAAVFAPLAPLKRAAANPSRNPCLAPRPPLEPAPHRLSPFASSGEVAEWLNAPHSKCGIRATVSGVRIPPSPPPFAFAGYGWQATEPQRAKGVSRSSAGAQGERCSVWYVYFIGLKNGDIYVGSTNDLRRRIASHQQGDVTSTSKYLPVALRSYVAVTNEAHARELERYFKSGSGKAFAKKRLLGKSE
jgi:putative endonuclease